MQRKDPTVFRGTSCVRFGEFNGWLRNANYMIVMRTTTWVKNTTTLLKNGHCLTTWGPNKHIARNGYHREADTS